MKSEIMERAFETGGNPASEKMRYGVAAGIALAVHGLLFSIFSFVPDKPMAMPKAPIPVKLVVLEAEPSAEIREEIPGEPEPEPEPALPPPPSTEAPSETVAEPQAADPSTGPSQPEILPTPAPPPSLPLSILSTKDTQIGEPIPERWRLPDGARIPLQNTQQARNPNLDALSKSLDCLGFDADCAVQRKVIFAEDQLSGTDLVWMRSYAHSGLSDSSLYGLSEAEIQERLGIMVAGKNGFMLLPGIVIDGPWWDALHGVNKACKYGLGVNDLGQKQLMKSCDPGKPSSKDKIAFVPKPVE